MLFFSILTGCSTTGIDLTPPAAEHNFVRQFVPAAPFVLTAWVKRQNPEASIHIYLEGDGRAFTNGGQTISPNPTPVKLPTGFKLAMDDPHPNVVYLARPCQFTPVEQNPTCTDNKWWSSHRYDATTLSALNTALDTLIATPNQQIDLIGYSGGATLALLAAATRTDITSVRTVAGNLSPETVNRVHGLRPMPLALSPVSQARHLATVPQIHFSGGKDHIVTLPVTEAYLLALPNAACTRHIRVEAASHSKGWVEKWPNLLKEEPACAN